MERQIPITIVTTTPSDNDEYSIILGNILILNGYGGPKLCDYS